MTAGARPPGIPPDLRGKGRTMKWDLRLAAARRGIWTASEMQRMLAARGLSFSAGKMSVCVRANCASSPGITWTSTRKSSTCGARRAGPVTSRRLSRSARLSCRGAVEALKQHEKRQAAERLKVGALYHDTGLVFRYEDGRMFSRWALNWRFSTAFLIGPDLLLTNHHVLFADSGRPATAVEIWFGYQRTFAGRDKAYVSAPGLTDTIVGDPVHGWAVIRVDGKVQAGSRPAGRCPAQGRDA
jgi:hypothetical protein